MFHLCIKFNVIQKRRFTFALGAQVIGGILLVIFPEPEQSTQLSKPSVCRLDVSSLRRIQIAPVVTILQPNIPQIPVVSV